MPGLYKPRKQWTILHTELHKNDPSSEFLLAQGKLIRARFKDTPGLQVRVARRPVKAFCACVHVVIIVARAPRQAP